ncbi:MAG: LysR family transcriptional regulator [Hydrococcus sp. Prado102]|nr:LysR family transcriptional regulator [Hydrococcus sp. Prado102]
MKQNFPDSFPTNPLWKSITLNQLQVFKTTAQHGSFTHAAKQLHLSQPTVSSQIKHLSTALGMPLFEQVGKQVYLTPAGQEVFDACQTIFERLEQLETNLAEFRGMEQGHLRLAAATTAKYFIPKLLNPFCQRYPSLTISLEITDHQGVVERLNKNLDDLYILSHLPEQDKIEAESLLCNPLVLVAPKRHPLTRQSHLPLKSLEKKPFIMRERGSETRSSVEQLLYQHKVSVQVKLELNSNEAIKQAVVEGLGLAVLSMHSLSANDLTQLAILNVEGFPIHRQWHVIFLREKKLSFVARTFLDYLLEESQAYCQVYSSLTRNDSAFASKLKAS